MVNKLLREAHNAGAKVEDQDGDSSEGEWGGLSDDEVPEAPIDLEEEYVDEDRYTTVTVEAVSVDRDGLHKSHAEPAEEEDGERPRTDAQPSQDRKKTAKERPKKKKKTFRYETKFERKMIERKQKSHRSRR